MEEGRAITDKRVLRNEHLPMRRKWDGNSNKTDESDLQFEKHDDPRISTEHGITIDSIAEHENASDSIRFNDDGDSNEIDESDLQYEKHDGPRIST
jgi:hypothetical protein